MIRKIVKLAVFLLIVNGVYQVAPVFVRHVQFEDAVQELVLYSQRASDAELVNGVMAIAGDRNVPLEREYVAVRHEAGSIHIDASYVEALRLLPRYTYQWEFEVDAKAMDLSAAGRR